MTEAAPPIATRSTRDRLLDAAEHLFAEKGFSGTSLRDIGRELDMPNASLLYHFPSKAQIYGAVLQRVAESFGRAYAVAADTPGDERAKLIALLHGLMDWNLTHPEHARIVMRELLDNVGRAAHARHWYLADVLHDMIGLVEAGQKRGVFRAGSAPFVVLDLIGSVSYFFAALPTSARIMDDAPDRLTAMYRAEVERHFVQTLLVVDAPAGGEEDRP